MLLIDQPASVVLILDNYCLALPIPLQPAFLMQATTSSDILTIPCSLEQICRDCVFDFSEVNLKIQIRKLFQFVLNHLGPNQWPLYLKKKFRIKKQSASKSKKEFTITKSKRIIYWNLVLILLLAKGEFKAKAHAFGQLVCFLIFYFHRLHLRNFLTARLAIKM